MINSLSFIGDGQPWPPTDADESARLKEHEFNEALYNNLHDKIFPKYSAYLADKAEDDKKVTIILGWGEKATTAYVNLVIGEPPDVELNGEDYFVERPDEEVLIDVSRLGFGLYEISQDGINCINPRRVYLVTDPGNFRKMLAYVAFAMFDQPDPDPKNKEPLHYVKFTIYTPGQIQHQIYQIIDSGFANIPGAEYVISDSGKKLKGPLKLAEFPAFAGLTVDANGVQLTGINDMLIVRVDNALSSDRRYGRSDYRGIAGLLEALELSFARREEVLAKFARPVFMAPESAFNHFNFARDAWEIRMEEPIMMEPGSNEAKFLTWQAELGAVEKSIEDKMDQLLYMLDLSRVLLAGKDSGGVASGTALIIRLIPSLSRARKYANAMKAVIPKVLSLDSKLKKALGRGGPAFEPEQIQVTFNNGVPRDPLQDAQACSLAVAGGFMSVETAISITQGLEMDGEAMAAEVDRIRAKVEPGLANVSEPPEKVPDEEGNGAAVP